MAKLPAPEELIAHRPPLITGGAVSGPRVPEVPQPGQPGAPLEALAKGFAHLDELMYRERERSDNIRTEDAFNQLRNTQLDLTLGKENGFINVKAGDAATRPLLQEWAEKFDATSRQIESSLANQQQKDKFLVRAGVAKAQFEGHILEHVAKETDHYAANVYKNTIDTEIRNIGATPNDPDAAGLSFERVNAAAAAEARRNGFSKPEEIAGVQAKARDALWHARLEAWRLVDPVGALRAFQDNQLQIGPEARVKLAESLYRDAAPVLAANLNDVGGPPVTATSLVQQKPENGIALARGIRNNNPGNIVQGVTKWAGEIEGADPRYASFATPEDGIRALGRNLVTYGERGIATVQDIIGRWAPATENQTQDYVARVAKEIGVNPAEPLNLKDRKVLTALATAIIKVENGTQPYSSEQIYTGIDAAVSGKPLAYENKRPVGQFAAASIANMTANDALRIVTGDPVIDRLPPDQKIAVFHAARTQANQGAAQAREAMKQRVTDAQAAYQRGLQSPNPPTATELIQAFGQFDGERISAELETSRRFGQDVKSVQDLPTTQQAALLATRTPVPGEGFANAEKQHEALARAIDVVQKERQQDPALAVLRNSVQVQDAFKNFMERLASGQDIGGAAQAYAAATLAEQQRLEVANPQVLTKEIVDGIAKRFAAPAQSGENVASVMRGLVDQWGRYWPLVGAQLSKSIPPEAVVIGLGIKPEAEQLLSEAVKLKPEALRQGIAEPDIRDLRDRIRKEFEPLQRTLTWQTGGIETYDNFADAAEKISIALMQKGIKSKDAAQKAFESMAGFKYEFEGDWRVPKAALGGYTSVQTIRDGAYATLRDVGSAKPVIGSATALLVPEVPVGVRPQDATIQWRDTVRSNGFWVTTPGDGGLTLYVKSGLAAQPVLDDRGMPVHKTWNELAAIGDSVRAAYHTDVRPRRP